MPLVLRARLGGYDGCLKFANAQLRARFPETPVELKESDVHQIYQLREDVIGVLFRFSVDGKPASFPSGNLTVHCSEEGTWSVVSCVYRRQENTSENWSGEWHRRGETRRDAENG